MDDHELRELSKKVTYIEETRQKCSGVSFENVVQYCIDLHDKTLVKLLEMQKFLEDNMGLFDCPIIQWNQRLANNVNFGFGNTRNKVAVYLNREKNILTVWLDEGLYFWYNFNTKRVIFISNNLGCTRHHIDISNTGDTGNHSSQYNHYNYFDCWKGGGYPEEGYERFFIQPTSLNVPAGAASSLEIATELKAKVEGDWQLAVNTYRCLIDAVEGIQKDEAAYLYKMKELIEGVKEK